MEKQYNYKAFEQEAQISWQTDNTYAPENNPGPLYTIDTPPPTVSGSLHIGHIFSYTQTDIIARYRRMKGNSVFYPFGFDDNGLPTERYVEKELNTVAHKHTRSEFIKLCLDTTEKVEEQFKQLWQQMGLSADLKTSYSTISESSRKISQESFIELYKKGYIYRKYEPALYCTTCRTSVAQAELDDEEKPSKFNDIVFYSSKDSSELLIGTTRPELLSSCVAIFYNPEDSRYTHLKNTSAIVPIFENTVPIYPDESVDINKGTGLVMCCTFGDKQDITWYKKFNLPYKQSIGLDGKWGEDTGILAGLKAVDARAKILEALAQSGLLRNQRDITHTVNIHERCKRDIEYIALSQWFLSILEHKKKFLEYADHIDWRPAFMKARYTNWVENISWDWCLSRQRFYGIPFPVWYCIDCKEIIVANKEDLPIDPQEIAFPGKTCPNCSGSQLRPDTDVMDTWNTSSLTPYICYQLYNPDNQFMFEQKNNLGDFLPMSMRPQAHDIIRTWAFYTIIKTVLHHNTIPWNSIVISGHVLSDKKEKLSKSRDTGKLSPQKLLETYPADVIRYWTASGTLGSDIAFSEQQLKIGQRLITKLWNAFKFIGEHSATIDFKKDVTKNSSENLSLINEWILLQLQNCYARYKEHLDVHEFGLALASVEQFLWSDFCDNYIECVKDQLFKPERYSPDEVTATRTTLYHVGLSILQLYAPYVPHITETLYRFFYEKTVGIRSLHQTRYSDVLHILEIADTNKINISQNMNIILYCISEIRKLKTAHQLSLGTDLASITLYSDNQEDIQLIEKNKTLLMGVTRAQAIIFSDKKLETNLLENRPQNDTNVWNAELIIKKLSL